MNPITETMYAGEFILSEGPRGRSRDTITIDQSQTLKAGTVLGQKTVGALSVAAAKTGAGTGVITGSTVAAGSKLGAYVASCVGAVANAGHFLFQDPDGIELGPIDVGTPFTLGGITATIADGGTDWAVDDQVTYTVTDVAGSGDYVALNPSATDGSQNASAISFAPVVTASGVTASAVGITRDAEVKGGVLDWAALTSDQITAATAQLAKHGIIVR